MSGQLKGRTRFERYIGKWFDWLMVSQREMKKILKEQDGKSKSS